MIIAVQEEDQARRITCDGVEISIESKSSLLDNLIDFEDYYREVERRITKECLPDSELTIQQTFVDPLIASEPDDIGADIDGGVGCQGNIDTSAGLVSLDRCANDWLAEVSGRQLVVKIRRTSPSEIAERLPKVPTSRVSSV
jgi:hypothetical protein